MHVLRAIAALILSCTCAIASEFTDDLAARRARAMERLGPEAMLILRSTPVRNYSLDVDYEYRQDSNLYYLTGITQPDTILVLMPGNASRRREILFVKPRDPVQEHWTGALLSRQEATDRTAIRTVLTTTQFEPFLQAILNRQGGESISATEAKVFFDALAAGRARIALTLETRALNEPPGPTLEFANRIRDRFIGFQITDVTPLFFEMRVVKTPYERRLLVESGKISSDAQLAGMRVARPGAFEYEVKASIEHVQRARGASWAYPSIVGSGPNATVLHYVGSERQLHAGDLLLADAGASHQYTATDITRTYPVSGAFSQPQKDIYAIVLRAQEEGIKAVKPGILSSQIHARTVEVIKEGLLKLGLITDTRGEQYRMWYTHGSTHYIGIDVHDVGERSRPLQAGMAFTIEPGIYVRQSVLDNLPRTPENLALIERIQPAVRKYADIGVRIEDSFLLEEAGLKNLSASVPKTIEQIEAFMQAR